MYLNLNPNCLGLGELSLDERLRLAKSCDYAGTDVPIGSITCLDDAEAIASRYEQAGLKMGLFWMPCDVSSADDASFEKCVKRLEDVAPYLGAVGVCRTYCHIWSGSDERPFEENWKWHLARLGRIGRIFKPHGIQFGLEFLGPHHLWKGKKHPFIHDLEGMLSLIGELGEPFGLVFDTFHWYTSGGTLEGLEKKLRGVPIVNVHLNDAVPGRALEDQLDWERQLPGETGVIPVREILEVFQQLHYQGPAIVEPFNPWQGKLKEMGSEKACRFVRQWMAKLGV